MNVWMVDLQDSRGMITYLVQRYVCLVSGYGRGSEEEEIASARDWLKAS